MKHTEHIIRNLGVTVAMLAVRAISAIPASAQVTIDTMRDRMDATPTQLKNWADPVINILLGFLFFSVVVSLVIAYVNKRKENNSNSNDKIIEALWSALIVVVGIMGAKFLFW